MAALTWILVILSLLTIGGIAAAVYFCYIRKRNKKNKEEPQDASIEDADVYLSLPLPSPSTEKNVNELSMDETQVENKEYTSKNKGKQGKSKKEDSSSEPKESEKEGKSAKSEKTEKSTKTNAPDDSAAESNTRSAPRDAGDSSGVSSTTPRKTNSFTLRYRETCLMFEAPPPYEKTPTPQKNKLTRIVPVKIPSDSSLVSNTTREEFFPSAGQTPRHSAVNPRSHNASACEPRDAVSHTSTRSLSFSNVSSVDCTPPTTVGTAMTSHSQAPHTSQAPPPNEAPPTYEDALTHRTQDSVSTLQSAAKSATPQENTCQRHLIGKVADQSKPVCPGETPIFEGTPQKSVDSDADKPKKQIPSPREFAPLAERDSSSANVVTAKLSSKTKLGSAPSKDSDEPRTARATLQPMPETQPIQNKAGSICDWHGVMDKGSHVICEKGNCTNMPGVDITAVPAFEGDPKLATPSLYNDIPKKPVSPPKKQPKENLVQMPTEQTKTSTSNSSDAYSTSGTNTFSSDDKARSSTDVSINHEDAGRTPRANTPQGNSDASRMMSFTVSDFSSQ